MATPSLEDYTPQQITQMAETYRQMVSNPATREVALRATKTLNPGASIPEIDLRDLAGKEFKARDERQDKLEQEIRERDARDRIRDERSTLRDKGYNADQVAAIEKVMTDKQIPSYATAAEYFDGQNKIAEPAPYAVTRPNTFTMPQNPLAAVKTGRNGLRDWGRNEAAAALDDIRSGRIKLSS